jgi:hypothetical protein
VRRNRLEADSTAPMATGQTTERHRVLQTMLCSNARSRRFIQFGQHAASMQ